MQGTYGYPVPSDRLSRRVPSRKGARCRCDLSQWADLLPFGELSAQSATDVFYAVMSAGIRGVSSARKRGPARHVDAQRSTELRTQRI